MRICAECFKAEDWKEHIRAYGERGQCDCCGQKEVVSIEVTDFEPFFSEMMRIYTQADDGKPLYFLIQRDFEIARDEECVKLVLKSIFPDTYEKNYEYAPSVLSIIQKWIQLKDKIKYEFRYFSGSDIESSKLDYVFECNEVVSKGSLYYRGRLNDREDYNYHTPSELGMPPKDLTPNGRANPHGIPCLYLTSLPETTMYELRSVYGDKISIASFKAIEPLKVLDFDKKPWIYEAYEDERLLEVIRAYLLKKRIGEELSKPMRRYDFKDLEYVSTQFVCEYIKKNGADGILYSSAAHQGGKNLVLFSDSKVKFVGVSVKIVDKSTMRFVAS